jgi:hypothetical protein
MKQIHVPSSFAHRIPARSFSQHLLYHRCLVLSSHKKGYHQKWYAIPSHYRFLIISPSENTILQNKSQFYIKDTKSTTSYYIPTIEIYQLRCKRAASHIEDSPVFFYPLSVAKNGAKNIPELATNLAKKALLPKTVPF